MKNDNNDTLIKTYEDLLDKFETHLYRSGNTVTITYKNGDYIGYVEYECTTKRGINKPIIQEVKVMVGAEMEHVIRGLNEFSPMLPEDWPTLNKLIREYSYNLLSKN